MQYFIIDVQNSAMYGLYQWKYLFLFSKRFMKFIVSKILEYMKMVGRKTPRLDSFAQVALG